MWDYFIFVYLKSLQMKTKVFLLSVIILTLVSVLFSCKKKDKDEKDTTPPVITIIGDNPYTIGVGTAYIDPGVTANDETDGDITSKIVITNNVDTSATGTYQVKYNVSDNAGNAAVEKVRNVTVIYMK